MKRIAIIFFITIIASVSAVSIFSVGAMDHETMGSCPIASMGNTDCEAMVGGAVDHGAAQLAHVNALQTLLRGNIGYAAAGVLFAVLSLIGIGYSFFVFRLSLVRVLVQSHRHGFRQLIHHFSPTWIAYARQDFLYWLVLHNKVGGKVPLGRMQLLLQ